MIDTSEHAGVIQALVKVQRFAVLSTRQDDGHPYASLVAFCKALGKPVAWKGRSSAAALPDTLEARV